MFVNLLIERPARVEILTTTPPDRSTFTYEQKLRIQIGIKVINEMEK